MKRRDFSLACGAALASTAIIQPAAWAQGKPFQAGTDFLVLDKRAPLQAPAGKIEVVEFFWYNCPHCNTFEPAFDAWAKRAPADMVVRRVPVAFREDFVPQQRLYHALEAMGLVEKLNSKVFAAIHVDKQKLDRAEAIIEWVVKQGVDKAKFLEHFNSFSIATKSTLGTQLQNAYKIEGVPSLGVAGRYLTDGTMAKSMGRALQVVEFLAAETRKSA